MPTAENLLKRKLQQGGVARSPLPEPDFIGETFARQLATRNPGPIATGKPCTYGHLDPDLAAAYASATEIMIGHFMDPGRLAQEQSSAFAKV